MANTGNKIFTKLVKVTNDSDEFPLDVNNELCSVSLLPQAQKPNTFGDINYIAPFASEDCTQTYSTYKIIKKALPTTTNQVVCGGSTYSDSDTTIRLQLVELDEVTPKVNATGVSIVIRMRRIETFCTGADVITDIDVAIPNGQTYIDIADTTNISDCGQSDCRYQTIEYTCYTTITPVNTVEAVVSSFYPVCV